MSLSVFDLFKIGIGPSSSHTVGPMRAAVRFVEGLRRDDLLASTESVKVELYGSLGATGKGHGSDKAVLLGLEGEQPDSVDTSAIEPRLAALRAAGELRLLGEKTIRFVEKEHLAMIRKPLEYHPNGMIFRAFDGAGLQLRAREYYSVGGGFVVDEEAAGADRIVPDQTPQTFPFKSAKDLLAHCAEHQLSISQLMLANEAAWRPETETRAGLLRIWQVMQDCVAAGCRHEGIMPGGLKVKRRAAALYRQLCEHPEAALRDSLSVLDWVNLYALAVNEENASGGRVVTAPTNGAAGIVPAVLHYYMRFIPGANEDGVVRFLLTAAAIGILYKENASISGAEVGCQGEVGVACSMAAGALGFIPKSADGEHLRQAVTRVLLGETLPLAGAKPPLTPRQQEILLLLADGLPNKAISRQLGLSEDTVKTHLKALFQELEVHTRTACVSTARQRGWL